MTDSGWGLMKGHLKTILLAGLYTFYYLVMELTVNDYAQTVLGGEHVAFLYGVCYLAVGLGYPLYCVSGSLVRSATAKRAILLGTAFLNVLSTLAVSFTNSQPLVIACAVTAHLTAGYFGGAVYYFVAMRLKGAEKIGLYIACACAGANLVQLFGLLIAALTPVTVYEWLERISLAAAMIIIGLILPGRMPVSISVQREASEPAPDIKKYLLGALAAMALISLMHGMTDGIITALHARGDAYIAYGYPRLFVLPGLLFAGAVADMKNKSILTFGTLAAMIVMVISVLLFYTPETYDMATCFVYFFGSFMSLYSIVVFMRIAPFTRNPALVAGSGRGVRYFFAGLAIIASGRFFETVSEVAFAAVYIVLVVLLFAVFFFMGQLHMPVNQEKEEKHMPDISRYNLTDRETEVLILLLHGKSTIDIASELFVTERTVRSHISNLLAKTSSRNRVEMIANLK